MARTPESAAVDFAESSLFTGRFSILALAACGVGFSLSGRLPAAIFSLAAAAVAAAARLWARHVLDGVNAALQAERSCVFPGEPCPLRVTLDNPKWLPLVWLTVRFPLEPGGALRPEHRWEAVELPEGGVQKPYYEKNVSFLLGHQRMSYTSRLQAEHRGLLSFDRIRLLSGDGLCLCVREKEIPLPRPVTLAVFPRLVPVSTRWFLRNSWELETGARGFQDDRTVIRNVRAYQPGDNARSLNFRLMARGQGAMVNIYEKISPRRAAFLLDGASFAGLPPEDFGVGIALFVLILLGMAVQPRFFCQFLCPMGAVFALLPVLPFARLHRQSDGCIPGCNACKQQCPVCLKLEENSLRSGECIACEACVGTCPKQNIHRWDIALCKHLWLPVLGKALLFFLLGCWLGFCRFI